MTINRVKIITASNTKIESEINKFFDSISKFKNVNIKDVEIRDGNNNNIATILYSYDDGMK